MNLKQLAARLRLSPATVSRVLGGKGADSRIGADTQRRVLAAAQRLGVTIDHQARALRLNATHTLGFVVPDISNPFFASLCRRVEQIARTRGYTVLVADSEENVDVEKQVLTMIRGRRVDGMIVAPVQGAGSHLSDLARSVVPLVFVDRVAPALGAPAVVFDNAGAARAGVRRLAAAGHRAIACLQGAPESTVNRERVRGYRAEMKALGLTVPTAWVAGGSYSVESGREGVKRLLKMRRPPTAILALGNLIALGALDAQRELELDPRRRLALVSFDEQPWAASLSPSLTTLAQPIGPMADRIMDLLFQRLASGAPPSTPERVVMPFTLIDRESASLPPHR